MRQHAVGKLRDKRRELGGVVQVQVVAGPSDEPRVKQMRPARAAAAISSSFVAARASDERGARQLHAGVEIPAILYF